MSLQRQSCDNFVEYFNVHADEFQAFGCVDERSVLLSTSDNRPTR
jgi:hypothetical protein